MTAYLSKRNIRIFDFTQFAKPLTDAVKANAESLAAFNGLQIDCVRKNNFLKEGKAEAVSKIAAPTRLSMNSLGIRVLHYPLALA